MTDLYIRDYKAEDFDAVYALWKETGMSGPARGDDAASVRNTLQNGGRLLVMINRPGEQLIGTSWLTQDGRRTYLHHFGILPSFQGRGLSKPLLEESLAVAKQMGMQVKLEVHRTNFTAVRLYEKYGFKALGDYDVYIIRNITQTGKQ